MSLEDRDSLAATQRLAVPTSPDLEHLRFRQPRIIIVDDDPDMLELLSAYLSGEGYDLRTHISASKALEAFPVLQPEVALVDLRIPDMDGLELIRRARQMSPDTLFVVISGYASVDNLIEAIRGGVNDYMTKPFSSAEEVRFVVENVLERQELQRHSKIHQITNEAILKLSDVSCVGDGRDEFMTLVRYTIGQVLGATSVATLYPAQKKACFRINTVQPLTRGPVLQLFSGCAKLYPSVLDFSDTSNRVDLMEDDTEEGLRANFGTVLRVVVQGLEGPEVIVSAAHHANKGFARFAVNEALSFSASLESVIKRQRIGASDEGQMIADMMNALTDGVAVLDQNNEVRYLNTKARVALGMPEGVAAIEASADVAALEDGLVRRADQSPVQKSIRLEVEGEEHIYDVDSSSFYTPNKIPYRMLLLRDVTHLAREAKAISELNEKLKELNDELVTRNMRLTAVNKELDNFVYMSSHDLREPFRHIQIFIDYLRKDLQESDALEGERRYLLDQIVKNGDIANRLLLDLRKLSKLTRMENPLETVNLGDLADEVVERFDVAIRDRSATLEIAELPTIRCDPIKIKEVLHNLIGNALKYGGESPRISMDFERTDDEILVNVRDRGIGIHPKYHDYVFEACRRIPNKDVEGCGLGLAIVRRMVEEHGGRVGVESELGEGANFWFTLPLVRESGD